MGAIGKLVVIGVRHNEPERERRLDVEDVPAELLSQCKDSPTGWSMPFFDKFDK
jgi:hypothetical protein